jgi:Fic family protein
VARHLLHLDSALKNAVGSLDQLIRVAAKPTTAGQLEAVVALAAAVHSRWVCVNPYANGNGRTARVWANWVAFRYGLPPFVRIKSRPDGLLYAQAAARSMGTPPSFRDDATLTYSLFLDLLVQQP